MAHTRVWVIGLACLVTGLLVGRLTVGGRSLPGSSASLAAPTESPSALFAGFDPLSLAEAVSARSRSQHEIFTASASMSGGGLRWGERWFTACWESGEQSRDDVVTSLETHIDAAISEAGMHCPNPVAGQWQLSSKLGAVYLTERRYSDRKHSGRLRAWLATEERGGQITMIVTLDEP